MEKETMLSLERLGVDTESALARFMNNGALYEKFLRRFVQDQNYAALTEAVREGRVQDAFAAAHTLKGVSANLSLTRLMESVSEVVEALRSYGLDTGLAFQIQDDLLNLVGTDEAKKKDFRSDITEGKRTLVVVHALQNTEPAARERLVEILSSKERDPEVLAEAVAIMEKTGSIDYARTFAEDLTLNAKARLAGALPPSPYRDLLVSMADWFVNRLK